jgi:Fic family protein
MNKTISEIWLKNAHLEKVFSSLMCRLIDAHLIGSTLVEGSTLSFQQAQKVLSGESIYGHIIDEHLELTNGRDAASYIHRFFFEQKKLTVKDLDLMHEILFREIGNPKEKFPGKNRGRTQKSAFTVIIVNKKLQEFQYAPPIIVKNEYAAYVDFHLNTPLSKDKTEAISQLAKLYFQFQILHPYSDGNGRIGRFLVSAKAASEKAWFFRFEVKDGPEHLRIMIDLGTQYVKNKKKVDYQSLIRFLDSHLEEL